MRTWRSRPTGASLIHPTARPRVTTLRAARRYLDDRSRVGAGAQPHPRAGRLADEVEARMRGRESGPLSAGLRRAAEPSPRGASRGIRPLANTNFATTEHGRDLAHGQHGRLHRRGRRKLWQPTPPRRLAASWSVTRRDPARPPPATRVMRSGPRASCQPIPDFILEGFRPKTFRMSA